MKIKGHTSIILKDVKTGKVERHEDDNLITNALANYFSNCGFMNYPNLDKNNMVELMLGGVMAFNDEIAENAATVYAPAGLKMIANGSVGVINNGEVLELGSYSSTESGWQNDGSYVQTYDYTTSQANGTIACVCLTSKHYGFIGEGNSISQVRHSDRTHDMYTLRGSSTDITGLSGDVFNYDFTNSTCLAFTVEERVNQQTDETYKVGVLRKYRLPISKINITGTLTQPIILQETEIQIDSDLESYGNGTSEIMGFAEGNKLYMWNTAQRQTGGIPDWGDGFTQYLWTLTSSGQLTKTTVTNTSGDTLKCLGNCLFDGNYCVFSKTYSNGSNGYVDPREIYIWNRSNGTMEKIENPYPQDALLVNIVSGILNWRSKSFNEGLQFTHGTGGGKFICVGTYPCVIDAINKTVYPTNESGNSIEEGVYLNYLYTTSKPLIRQAGGRLHRDAGYIASINNLETPVVKTAEKTMKIIYRLTFEEEENE